MRWGGSRGTRRGGGGLGGGGLGGTFGMVRVCECGYVGWGGKEVLRWSVCEFCRGCELAVRVGMRGREDGGLRVCVEVESWCRA